MIYYLVTTLIISFVNIGLLMVVNSKRSTSYFTAMFYVITIQLAGHVFLALSSNIEEAILANKMAYIGAVFIPALFFLGELTICNIKPPRAVRIGIFSFSTIVLCFAFTAGFSDIFYESVTLVQNKGVTDFTAEFGPAHKLFNIMLFIYLISGICVLVYSLLKKRNFSYRNLQALAIIAFLSIGAFFIFRELGCDMLAMPSIYIGVEFIMLCIIRRISMYDIEGTVRDTLEYQNENAYLSISKNRSYIGCNDIAAHYFPVLKTFRIDSKIRESDEFGSILIKLIEKFNPENLCQVDYFQYGNKHYKSVLRHLYHGSRVCGYLFRIEDDTKVQRYIKLLDKYNTDLAMDVQNKDSHIQAMQEQLIIGMSNMVENRDSNAGGHIKRTSQVAKILINEMKKDESFRHMNKFFNAVVKVAPMHDLGKIAVDDTILRKPGKYTAEEFNVMKTHSEKGAAIVENLLKDVESQELITIAKNVTNFHHERYDGSGYPMGLKGDEIPLEARIMAVADVYDALVSRRSYKERMTYAEAYDIIVSSMGTHFDPMLKKFFINCHKEIEAFYDSCNEA
ncbi:MAG: HD domain-containing protein [Fibrobacter sp.]|nr:HD domain-containing protein [Fibrobacter sp.]